MSVQCHGILVCPVGRESEVMWTGTSTCCVTGSPNSPHRFKGESEFFRKERSTKLYNGDLWVRIYNKRGHVKNLSIV